MTTRQALVLLAKCLVAAALVGFLYHSGQLDLAQLGRLGGAPLALAACLGLFVWNQFLTTTRWWLLMRARGLAVAWWPCYLMNLAGLFASMVLPGLLAGDVGKTYLLSRRSAGGAIDSFSTIVVDRLIGAVALIVLGTASVEWLFRMRPAMAASNASLPGIRLGMWIGLAAGVGGLACLLVRPLRHVVFFGPLPGWLPSQGPWGRVRSLVLGVRDAFGPYLHHRVALTIGFILSLANHLSTVLIFLMLADALGNQTIDTVWFFVFLPIAASVNSIPIAPAGGLGQGEAALGFLLGLVDPSGNTLGVQSWLAFRVVWILTTLPGGIVWWRIRQWRRAASTPPTVVAEQS